jgi:hypothetical protein
MGWKTIRVTLLAIALGVAGASAAAAMPARAATMPAVHATAQPNAPEAPQVSVRYVTFVYSDGADAAVCFNGQEDSILAPEYVSNGCTTRVWLYQYSNETGYSLCLRPNSTTGHLNRTYHSFRVVASSKTC